MKTNKLTKVKNMGNEKQTGFSIKRFRESIGISQPEITGPQAALRGKYHGYGLKDKTFNKIVSTEASNLNEEICQIASDSKLILKAVDPFQKPLYNALKRIFEERGFNVFFLNNKILPQLGNTAQEYLVISWDMEIAEEKEFI